MRIDEVRDWLFEQSGPAICAIDGPAGAGKSTMADTLCPPNWTLIRLDDVYPGWEGLDAGISVLQRELVGPLLGGRVGRWPRWDWHAGRVADWVPVAAGSRILLEGCGAVAAASAGPEPNERVLRLWLDAPAQVRAERLRQRDGEQFDPFWPIWERHWNAYVRALNVKVTTLDLD